MTLCDGRFAQRQFEGRAKRARTTRWATVDSVAELAEQGGLRDIGHE